MRNWLNSLDIAVCAPSLLAAKHVGALPYSRDFPAAAELKAVYIYAQSISLGPHLTDASTPFVEDDKIHLICNPELHLEVSEPHTENLSKLPTANAQKVATRKCGYLKFQFPSGTISIGQHTCLTG